MAEGDNDMVGAEQPAPAASTKSSKPVKDAKYVLAEGQSRTTKRGTLTAGDEVKPDYLGGGKESFDALVKKGVIVKES